MSRRTPPKPVDPSFHALGVWRWWATILGTALVIGVILTVILVGEEARSENPTGHKVTPTAPATPAPTDTPANGNRDAIDTDCPKVLQAGAPEGKPTASAKKVEWTRMRLCTYQPEGEFADQYVDQGLTEVEKARGDKSYAASLVEMIETASVAKDRMCPQVVGPRWLLTVEEKDGTDHTWLVDASGCGTVTQADAASGQLAGTSPLTLPTKLRDELAHYVPHDDHGHDGEDIT